MLTNSDCTIFHKAEEGFEKQYISECWWFDDTKADITTEGLKAADVVKVRIPDVSVYVAQGDIIVKGWCNIEAQSVRDLDGVRYFKVISSNYNVFAEEMHIKVVAV